MSAPWPPIAAPNAPIPFPSAGATEMTLRRLDHNLTELLWWMKVLVTLTGLILLVNVLFVV